MAKQKAKGSIIYELLIVILIAGLIGTILYPKSIWEEEEAKTTLCRDRMMQIYLAELLYWSYTNTYTDSLPELVEFILGDTTLERLKQYIASDSALVGDIIDHFQDKVDKQEIINALAAVIDTLETDTVKVNYLDIERLAQRIPTLPVEKILGDWRVLGDSTLLIDTLMIDIPLKHILETGPEFVQNNEIIKTLWFVSIDIRQEDYPEDWIIELLQNNPLFTFKTDSMAEATIRSFSLCPTVGDSLIVTVVDTSELKHLIISCPIDSTHTKEF